MSESSAATGLFWRALFAFLALPGVVAFAAPLLWINFGASIASFDAWGLALLTPGLTLLFWTIRDFYVAGRGTLAPWSPPQELVVVGLYRYSRNPMYVAVLLVLCGWALGFHSEALAVYAAAVGAAFHLRVVLGEEPWLAKTHGEKWTRYQKQVPRWLGARSRDSL